MANNFAINPLININRSKFNQNHIVKTSFNAGKLIPIEVKEILPGDTVKLKTNVVIRTSTPPIKPIMDNLFLDIFYFFVPNRTVWKHWEEFMGANKSTYWTQQTQYTIPQLKPSTDATPTTPQEKSVADYFGIPIGKQIEVSQLPFRGYCKIFNDWFRDENVMTPAYYTEDETDITWDSTFTSNTTYINSAYKGGMLCPVAKLHDLFTSALPEPQKGIDVTIPLGTSANVYGTGDNLVLGATNNSNIAKDILLVPGGTSTVGGSAVNAQIYQPTGGAGTTITGINPLRIPTKADNVVSMYADLTTATAASINQLRQAFQLQRMFEKDARGGTRYVEILKNHFGVTSSDARLQRAEYLGGKRIPINIQQVIQSSETSTTPQGNPAAFSLTADSSNGFTKSFEEHGYLFTLCCVRQTHSYDQGLNKMWSRKIREDFYFPVFANLGEQPILNKEIYAQGKNVTDNNSEIIDNQVFGYQEAWYEYRYTPAKITGQMRGTASNSYYTWHLGDNYASLPTLSDTFIEETDVNIQRMLSGSSSSNDQFLADFYFEEVDTRPMPTYSIPGLIDHN